MFTRHSKKAENPSSENRRSPSPSNAELGSGSMDESSTEETFAELMLPDVQPEWLASKCESLKERLENIFLRKVYCERHEQYRKGGKSRVNLSYQVQFGMFSEKQQKAVAQTLVQLFCSDNLTASTERRVRSCNELVVFLTLYVVL
eukprot:m.138763 g.138763  ORF g.138763 m.138763 type:complete len:146 (+) comp38258_c0_seq9:196-633(+)